MVERARQVFGEEATNIREDWELCIKGIEARRQKGEKKLEEYVKRERESLNAAAKHLVAQAAATAQGRLDSAQQKLRKTTDRATAAYREINVRKGVRTNAAHIPPDIPAVYKYNESDERTIEDYYYKLLGVSRGATQTEIREAYKLKRRLYHPDKFYTQNVNTEEDQNAMFKLLTRAYILLHNPENASDKAKYDRMGNKNGWVLKKQGDFRHECFSLSAHNPYAVVQ